MTRLSSEDTEVPASMSGLHVDDHLGHLLRCVQKRASAAFSKELSDYDLTPAQFFAMARLLETGPISQNHLGRLTAMDPATIQGVTQRLLTRGLIERTPDREDRRRMTLRLVPKSESMVRKLRSNMTRASDSLLEPLSPHERDTLMDLLKRLT